MQREFSLSLSSTFQFLYLLVDSATRGTGAAASALCPPWCGGCKYVSCWSLPQAPILPRAYRLDKKDMFVVRFATYSMETYWTCGLAAGAGVVGGSQGLLRRGSAGVSAKTRGCVW